MNNDKKNLIDNNEEGYILNESGTSVRTDKDENHKVTAEEGSKSDPQLTEFDGLKKGGVEPHINPGDEGKIKERPESDR